MSGAFAGTIIAPVTGACCGASWLLRAFAAAAWSRRRARAVSPKGIVGVFATAGGGATAGSGATAGRGASSSRGGVSCMSCKRTQFKTLETQKLHCCESERFDRIQIWICFLNCFQQIKN